MRNLLLLGKLLRETGTVDGRKKLQKLVHILQVGGVDFGFAYEFSYFGPYSAELKGSMDELVAAELVAESPLPTGNGYRYVITDKFSRLLDKVGVTAKPAWSGQASSLNHLEARELEGISTVLFLESNGWTGDELSERFSSLKPHLKDDFQRLCEDAHRLREEIKHQLN